MTPSFAHAGRFEGRVCDRSLSGPVAVLPHAHLSLTYCREFKYIMHFHDLVFVL